MSAPSWARGFDVAELKDLAKIYKSEFKQYTHGAFGIPNERDIATAKDEGNLLQHGQAVAISRTMKMSISHSDFSGASTQISKGETIIKSIAGPTADNRWILDHFIRMAKPPLWIEIHEENQEKVALLKEMGFNKVLTKVTAASDIKGLYAYPYYPPPKLERAEEIGLKRLMEFFLSEREHATIQEEIEKMESGINPWMQHYSSYNKRQSWTAFALKGFDNLDPGFIIKPAEMAKKWKDEHPERLAARCDWTPAAEGFPKTIKILKDKIPCEFQRVRFMRLASGGGELTRHADITDPEAGIMDEKIARLHIPIATAPGCVFNSWDLNGNKITLHFAERGLYYLDTRKPHAVVNTSPATRIHLVVDCYSNSWLRGML